MKPLLSVNDLAARLGMWPQDLRALADKAATHYRHDSMIVGSKARQLHIPDKLLMEAQRRLNRKVFALITPSPAAHGGIKHRSPRTNAVCHTGTRCVTSIDVREFFPSVHHGAVHAMLMRELGFGRDVASIITKLVTHDGVLPQGAPTSSTIANLLLRLPLDESILPIAAGANVNYSRFVDDIALSGTDPRVLIQRVTSILASRRLPIHRLTGKPDCKFRIMSNRSRQMVTGLVVNQRGRLTVPRAYRDEIRAAIFNLRRIEVIAEAQSAARSIRGKIQYIAPYHPEQSARLSALLLQALDDIGCQAEPKPRPRNRRRKTPMNLRVAAAVPPRKAP